MTINDEYQMLWLNRERGSLCRDCYWCCCRF